MLCKSYRLFENGLWHIIGSEKFQIDLAIDITSLLLAVYEFFRMETVKLPDSCWTTVTRNTCLLILCCGERGYDDARRKWFTNKFDGIVQQHCDYSKLWLPAAHWRRLGKWHCNQLKIQIYNLLIGQGWTEALPLAVLTKFSGRPYKCLVIQPIDAINILYLK